MLIAVEGCMHGELDNVYASLKYLEEQEQIKIDLLICCGDFQAVRNEKDLESLNVPPKYRSMNSFWKYYSGNDVAPYPTIFIGGNHEASNYLWDLRYGGWAAPNIYFLGYAGVVKYGNIRIAGLSGIYNARHYRLGHYERPPYDNSDIRSVYHVRHYEVYKLLQIEEPIDIFLSHDWPRGITDFGDWKKLVRQKPFFEKEIQEKTLGSNAAAELLEKLKPSYWFSAHLHCKFAALVQHGEGGSLTKFLALDKCVPDRDFLQIIDVESEPGPYEMQYDEEWLAITKYLHSVFPSTWEPVKFEAAKHELEECRQWVKLRLEMAGAKTFEFVRTVPCHDPLQQSPDSSFPEFQLNPQMESFLELLELPHLSHDTRKREELMTVPAVQYQDVNEEEIPIEDVDDLEEGLEAGSLDAGTSE